MAGTRPDDSNELTEEADLIRTAIAAKAPPDDSIEPREEADSIRPATVRGIQYPLFFFLTMKVLLIADLVVSVPTSLLLMLMDRESMGEASPDIGSKFGET